MADLTDPFDRILGDLTGLPGHDLSRPATITTALPILGSAQTYVVRTMRTPDNRFIGFVEMIDANGKLRIAIPQKAMAALYRQRDALVTHARSRLGKEKWQARQHKTHQARALANPHDDPETRPLRDLLKF